jgi:ATP-dependent Clp protease protease subunit
MNKIVLGLMSIFMLTLAPYAPASMDNGPQTIILTSDNSLVLAGEVSGDTVGPIVSRAKKLDATLRRGVPLYLYMNTPGGSVQSGLELIEALKGLGRPVHTISQFSASMGFQIIENLNERYILKTGILMSHRATGSFEGSFGGTTPSQLDSRIHLFVEITKELDEITVARTNGKQTLESYQKAYANELWLTGAESLVAGYADAIVKVKCDKSLSGTSMHSTEFLGVPVTYELDNCPLNSSPMNVKIGENAGVTKEYREMVKRQFISGYQMKSVTPLPMVY